MSSSPAPLSSYPFATSPSATVETIGGEVIRVVIPFNEGTVAEARAAALAVVSNITPDDITGLVPALADKATHQDVDDVEARLAANTIVNALMFS